VILLFHREVAENCALVGYHAANSSGFRTDVSGQSSKKKEPGDVNDRLSRNVGEKLPLLAE
jgi:hypothetical protein